MAWEVPLFMPGGLRADADLSANQFHAVVMDTTDNDVVLAGAGVRCLGILQNKPANGEEAAVMFAGFSKVVVGSGTGGLTAGDRWTPDASGEAVVAGTGDIACGTVIEGAGEGGIATVTVGLDAD